jgi:hypothetical protein
MWWRHDGRSLFGEQSWRYSDHAGLRGTFDHLWRLLIPGLTVGFRLCVSFLSLAIGLCFLLLDVLFARLSFFTFLLTSFILLLLLQCLLLAELTFSFLLAFAFVLLAF